MAVCWVIWYCYFLLLGFKWIFYCTVYDSLYHTMDIVTMWHCALVSCSLWQSSGLFFVCFLFFLGVGGGGAFLWCWVSLCVHFTNSLIEFYFIMIVVFIMGIFMAILFILIYTFRLSVTKYLVLQMRTSLNISVPGHSLWTLDWTCYLRTPLCLG